MNLLRSTGVLLASSLLLLSSSASAHSVSLIWVGGPSPSTTTGVLLGPTITLGQVGSSVFLDVLVTADPSMGGITLASLSVAYETLRFDAVSVVECPLALGNALGACAFPPLPGDTLLTPVGGAAIDDPAGEVQSMGALAAITGTGNSVPVTFTLARIELDVTQPNVTNVDGFYRPGIDGIIPSSGIGLQFPAIAGARIVPEPGTLALLGLGLGALALGRTRTRS